jgi:hypothetical protein
MRRNLSFRRGETRMGRELAIYEYGLDMWEEPGVEVFRQQGGVISIRWAHVSDPWMKIEGRHWAASLVLMRADRNVWVRTPHN